MSTQSLPFQKATAKAALAAFSKSDGPRRFLIADEVGLGKTVVAQHIIEKMLEDRHRPLVVFYVCSSLAVAAQNRRKLLELLPQQERESAVCEVDRLTLMPAAPRPSNRKLHLYTLTPDTSVPMRKGRRRDGRKEERALLQVLIRAIWPCTSHSLTRKYFQRTAKASWDQLITQSKKIVKKSGKLKKLFERSIRKELGLVGRHGVDSELVRRSKDDALDLIAHLRNALAASALEETKPDLIIFDEFQRFRDLLFDKVSPDEARVVDRLRGEGLEEPPALLLLSATPFRLYSRSWDESTGSSHLREFFEVVEFLFGGGIRAKNARLRCEELFKGLARELRLGTPSSDAAITYRKEVQNILMAVMSRTERASTKIGHHQAETKSHKADLSRRDLVVYRHLSDSLDPRHRSGAVPYWTSIPLPMQAMGPRYVAWKSAKPAPSSGVPALDPAMRDRFARPREWPHPRMRAMQSLMPSDRLALPWIAPSLPWWGLKGGWEDRDNTSGKMLVFSRFRAVPPTISAILSYDMEARLLRSQAADYVQVGKKRVLQASGNRFGLFGLFYPSPWLVINTEPLEAVKREVTPSLIRTRLRRQIEMELQKLGITVSSSTRKRAIWKLLAQIDQLAGYWEWVWESWWEVEEQTRRSSEADAGLGSIIDRVAAEAEKSLKFVTPHELTALADFALSAPGIVVGRALYRHWPGAMSRGGFTHTIEASWLGLRTYLDNPWFMRSLSVSGRKYPHAIRLAVVNGNLESLLDEHLWITCKLGNLSGVELARQLHTVLSLRTSLFFLHQLSSRSKQRISLRCHAAMPFIEARGESELGIGPEAGGRPLRADELRRAFNAPFWPHVLATTSVGQEGLDFHVWCNTIVHWDLCGNPVDLEQREGRIQRYGGLAVRRKIAERLAHRIYAEPQAGRSPWSRLGEYAKELEDDSGLSPWWNVEGADIERYVFDVPSSEQRKKLAWLHEQRLLYRLALGQPDQEDLLEVLVRKLGIDEEEASKAAIGLSAWFDK
jgi:hypothetical protein